MLIPKEITVGKTCYSVEQQRHAKRRGGMGHIDYDAAEVTVFTHSNITGRRFKTEELSDSFWHELTHAILEDMGSSLEANEKFVTAFSSRLNNAILSAKF